MADRDDLKMAGTERSSGDIRNDIAAKRESISQTVGRLGEKIDTTLDWKAHVARNPYASIGLAIGVGLIVGHMLRRKPSPTERIVEVLVDKAEEVGDTVCDSVRKLFARAVAPTLFRGTLYGIAGKALMQYLHDRTMHAEGNGGTLSQDPL